MNQVKEEPGGDPGSAGDVREAFVGVGLGSGGGGMKALSGNWWPDGTEAPAPPKS